MTRSRWCGAAVAALVFVAGLVALAEPCTITVEPTESIQAAIDAASPGDVICLSSGEWEENKITIEKSLTLQGEGADTTIIRAALEFLPVVLVSSPESGTDVHVVIENLTVTGARGRDAFGILVECSARATIKNSTISDNFFGIGMMGYSQATVDNSTISENGWAGIVMFYSAQATIKNNTISGNSRGGIYIRDSAQATIMGNAIQDNARYGVVLRERPCLDTDDVFTGYITGLGNTIPGPDAEDGNLEGAVCPDELAFLMTEEGGVLDRREEE